MTSPEVSIDENGFEWVVPKIDDNADNYKGILPNTILGFRPEMKVPSYSHNDLSSNINNLPSVFNDNDKNAEIADNYIGDLPKIDEKPIAGINNKIRNSSLLKTMENKRLLTYAKYGDHNKKQNPKFSGLTLKQAKYHNELIDVLLENGLYERIYQKSCTDDGSSCFDNLDVDEIDLMTKFEYIEPELLHTCYIDTSTPDNP
jgi:hypothetical protein